MFALDLLYLSREEYAVLCDCASEKAEEDYPTSERGILRLLEARQLVKYSNEVHEWRITEQGKWSISVINAVASVDPPSGPAHLLNWRR